VTGDPKVQEALATLIRKQALVGRMTSLAQPDTRVRRLLDSLEA
jgi:hypothetical protein